MSYRCGIGPGMRDVGLEPREPGFYCDVCQRRTPVTNIHGMPRKWFLNGKLPPKWKRTDRGDTCPVCLTQDNT